MSVHETEKPDGMLPDWELPPFRVEEFRPRQSDYCIATATWNEGEKCRLQYEKMTRYTRELDLVVVNRGEDLVSEGTQILAEQYNLRTLMQVDEPGQSTAYRVALAYCLSEGYEGIITIDSNGKDGVDRIPAFAEMLDEGYDLVQGSRFMKGGYHENTRPCKKYCVS